MKKVLICMAGMLFLGANALNAAPIIAAQNEAFVLLNGLNLWDFSTSTPKALEQLTIGDKVQNLGQVQKFKKDGVEKDYVHIRSLSGKEGWVTSGYVASNATLGVIQVDTSLVYKTARDIDVTTKTIPQLAIVAVFKDGGTDSFAKITWIDPATSVPLDSVFVTRSDISISDVDVNAILLYTVAMTQKSAALKKNLLTVAAAKYGRTQFADKIQAALNPQAAVATKATSPASGKYVTNDDNVNVRNSPDEKNGAVVGVLTRDVVVDVVEATNAQFTVGGQTAQWFHVKGADGLDGWIFGAFLNVAK